MYPQTNDQINFKIFQLNLFNKEGVINVKILTKKAGLDHTQLKILKFQFKLYDKDGSGSVELPEMIEILVMIYQVIDRCG